MTKTTLALAAALLGGLTFGVGQASAVPAGPAAIEASTSTVTPVRMGMRDRMMERRMMKRRMMKRRMMRRM